MTDTAELHLAAENRELRETIAAVGECIKANNEERQDWQRELLAAKSDFEALCRLIADDAFACTFQSMGQYRTELLKAARPGENG